VKQGKSQGITSQAEVTYDHVGDDGNQQSEEKGEGQRYSAFDTQQAEGIRPKAKKLRLAEGHHSGTADLHVDAHREKGHDQYSRDQLRPMLGKKGGENREDGGCEDGEDQLFVMNQSL